MTSNPLASRDRADHPEATDQTCSIRYPHPEHAYGRIMPGGGLRFWCRGKES